MCVLQPHTPLQAYLSLTRGACSARSTRLASNCSGPRERFALCGLSAINGHAGTARKVLTQPPHMFGAHKTQPQRQESKGGRDEHPGVEHVFWRTNASGRRVVRDGFIEGGGYGRGGHRTRPTSEVQRRQGHGQSRDTLECHVEALEAQTLSSSSPYHGSGVTGSSPRSSEWCQTQSPRTRAALDYYPSRPVSAGEAVAVSLISPRTSKRIRRLPRPAESELENLQVHTHLDHTPSYFVLLLYCTHRPRSAILCVHIAIKRC